MRKYIYISYSQKDSVFADKLTNKLFESGLETWFDKAEISAGDNWQKKMDDGIKGAAVLIFISSKNSINSKWTTYEVTKFLEKGGHVIPILIDEYSIDNLPGSLNQLQHLDFRISFDNGFPLLLKALSVLSIYKNPNLKEREIKSKGYVFLSYCEEDKNFVLKLRSVLKDNGYAYWDYEENDRDYHNQLFIELEDAIINAAATLSVLSSFWKQSKWALKEYFFSEEVGTPVFLLKASFLQPTLAIAGVPYIDFTVNEDTGFEKLSKELKRKGL